MPLFLQDAIVTAMAMGAMGLVVRRVVGVFNPPPAAPACSSCSSCPAPRTVAEPNRPVPLIVVGRKADQ